MSDEQERHGSRVTGQKVERMSAGVESSQLRRSGAGRGRSFPDGYRLRGYDRILEIF